jgi:hypothetical protein
MAVIWSLVEGFEACEVAEHPNLRGLRRNEFLLLKPNDLNQAVFPSALHYGIDNCEEALSRFHSIGALRKQRLCSSAFANCNPGCVSGFTVESFLSEIVKCIDRGAIDREDGVSRP